MMTSASSHHITHDQIKVATFIRDSALTFQRSQPQMRIGVPKEIKLDEHRVGLTPASVREYRAHGHDVIVESGAAAGLGIADEAYRAAGATVVNSAEDVFAADMIVKVKEPQRAEWERLRRGQILFTYLH